MKRLEWLFGLCLGVTSAFAQAPQVSNIKFDAIGDSSVQVLFDVTGTYNKFRLRYGTSDTASGSGGFVQTNSTVFVVRYEMAGNLSGLAPNTTYYVSPEVSADGGTTWSSGVSATFTTLPRTQTLPAPPVPVSTTFPPQTGTVRNVASNCSNLQTQINAAQAGDTIVVPAGTVCAGSYTLPNKPGLKTFAPANVRTSDSTITLANHGFTENQEIRLSASFPNQNCLPGQQFYPFGLGYNCDFGGGGWRKGGRYWVHVADSSHVQILDAPGGNPVVPGWIKFSCSAAADTITITASREAPSGISFQGGASIPANTPVQFHSTGTLCGGLAIDTNYFLETACPAVANMNCTTRVSTSVGGAAVNITSAGSGLQRIVERGSGVLYIAPAPDPNAPWIVITSGGSLPPVGARTAPGFDTQAFHLRQPTPLSGPFLFSTGVMTHNWRIVGAIFDTATNTDYQTSIDPRGYCRIIATSQDSENIIFDRTRVQGAGYPNRFGCSTAILLQGRNVGVINSDWRGMDYWHPWTTGFTGSFTGSSVTLSAGNAYAGPAIFNAKTTANTVITVTSGGGVTGTAYVYFGMDGELKVRPPSGVSLTCNTQGVPCTVLPGVASPGWPVNALGRTAGLKVATFNLASGVVAGVCARGCTDPFPSAENTEGSQAIIAGVGPGPYLFDNNFISGTGIPLHFDDGGGPFQKRCDYTITRNTFDVPASQLAGGPQSDGLRYGHRQTLEWKAGCRIKVDGNIFQGSFSEMTPAGVTIAVTPVGGGVVTDFDFTNNTIVGVGGLDITRAVNVGRPSPPGQRIRVSNNLFLLNGPAYHVPGSGSPRGWAMFGGYGSEDLLIDHNTVFDNRGNAPSFLYWLQHPIGGVTIRNNIMFYSGNHPAIKGEEVCNGAADKALMDCAFTNGPGVPGYTFRNNVIVPSWADSIAATGYLSPSTVASGFPTLQSQNNFLNGGSLTANLEQLFAGATTAGTYRGLDLRLKAQSPYVRTASDGTQAGANMEQLQQAQQRIIQLRALGVSANAATISAYVPEAGERCYAGYGTSAASGDWTWTAADTANSRERNFSVTGLTQDTRYFYSVLCARSFLPSVEQFRTQ